MPSSTARPARLSPARGPGSNSKALIQSRPRKARIERAFAEEDRAISLESIKRVLRDHEDYPRSICRHANDHPTNGYWVSVFSVIIEADSGRMHVSRGNPCTAPYETYQLN